MAQQFGCEIEITADGNTGEVTLRFGPIDAGDVKDLLEYLRHSETVESEILDHVAATFAKGLPTGLTDA